MGDEEDLGGQPETVRPSDRHDEVAEAVERRDRTGREHHHRERLLDQCGALDSRALTEPDAVVHGRVDESVTPVRVTDAAPGLVGIGDGARLG